MYDSKIDTLIHINRVEFYILKFLDLSKQLDIKNNVLEKYLIFRAKAHDKSKLEDFEKNYFDIYSPKLN